MSENGMVTAMHPLAAQAGVATLQDGGTAADAAIAATLTSGVVEPFMSGLGGAAYAVAYDARTSAVRCFDGSAVLPGEASEGMFELASAVEPRSGVYGWRATRDDASETGFRSVAVPGALACLSKLHEAAGKKSWRELFGSAIYLAEEGFDVDDYFFVNAAAAASRLRPFPETVATFLHTEGRVPLSTDAHLSQADLARTLSLIAEEGPRCFYDGRLTREIVSFVRSQGGVLAREDLASYDARELPPLRTGYRRAEVCLLPGRSGGPTVARALRVLQDLDLASHRYDAVERLHAIAAALVVSFRERLRPGVDPPEQHTTHVNVVDRERNMVSLTATLGARFGSGVTVPGVGVVLNNGMMWFNPEPGHLNSVRPRERALHAAAPCLFFDGEGPSGCVGSPGARRIMSAVLQVLLALIDHRMGAQEAVEAPRIHCEDTPAIVADNRFSPSVVEGLRARGYGVDARADSLLRSYFGRPSAIVVRNGLLRGGVEPHREGTAVGF